MTQTDGRTKGNAAPQAYVTCPTCGTHNIPVSRSGLLFAHDTHGRRRDKRDLCPGSRKAPQ